MVEKKNKQIKSKSSPVSRDGKPNKDLSKGSFFSRYKGLIISIICLYLLIAVFFHPVVLKNMSLSPAADMIAAAGMYEAGEKAMSEGRFPLWNPTLFCGLPMFASLQYALFVYPPEYFIRVLSFVFGGGSYRIWLFHYLLAGIFAYLLARHYKCGKLASWMAGAAFAFSPQLIVLADVGHGSKLMGMTWLPLIWLMTDRLRLKPSIGRAAALGAVFAVEILALHPQVAAYSALMMGLLLLYYGISSFIKKESKAWLKFTAFWAGAMGVAVALSAILWVSVLDFARFSIRGASDSGIAGGGVAWDYATGWSFHPLESITYLFPRFMGFGGQTYWGTVGTPQGVPFTHNPMYFGCIVLFLAIMAMILLPRRKWGYALTLAIVAWVLSFGKYLPLLYGLFYHVLPFFNKFRAPVMGQVLLLLPMSLLAGMGLEEIIRRVRTEDTDLKLNKILWWFAGITGGLALIFLSMKGVFDGFYTGYAGITRDNIDPNVLGAARELARPDAARSLALLAFTGLVSVLVLKKKMPVVVFGVLISALVLVDLWPVNKALIPNENYTPKSYTNALFSPEQLVNKFQRDDDKFRIHPVNTRYRAANWWSYFGLESTTGYFGAKLAAYQKLMTMADLEGWGTLVMHPKLLDALNVRYIILDYPLDAIYTELSRQGMGDPVRPAAAYEPVITPRQVSPGRSVFVYKNPYELPRARLVGEYRIVQDLDQAFAQMLGGDWDPAHMALIDREPSLKLKPDGDAKVEIVEYRNEKVEINVLTDTPQLLVLADTYYPSGWRALIDENETEILRVDGVMRGVEIPEGVHKVEFIFKPGLFYVGLWISIVSTLVLLVLGTVYIIRKRSR